MADYRAQEAINQAIFREMNEWTEDDTDGREGLERAMDTYLCECGDVRCSDPIRLTRAEYEGIRSEATRFALALDHENPEIDSVISVMMWSTGCLMSRPLRGLPARSRRIS